MAPLAWFWHPVCHVLLGPTLDAHYPTHTHEYLWYLCISNGTGLWLHQRWTLWERERKGFRVEIHTKKEGGGWEEGKRRTQRRHFRLSVWKYWDRGVVQTTHKSATGWCEKKEGVFMLIRHIRVSCSGLVGQHEYIRGYSVRKISLLGKMKDNWLISKTNNITDE